MRDHNHFPEFWTHQILCHSLIEILYPGHVMQRQRSIPKQFPTNCIYAQLLADVTPFASLCQIHSSNLAWSTRPVLWPNLVQVRKPILCLQPCWLWLHQTQNQHKKSTWPGVKKTVSKDNTVCLPYTHENSPVL